MAMIGRIFPIPSTCVTWHARTNGGQNCFTFLFDFFTDSIRLEDSALPKGSQMKFDALKSKSVRLDISFKSPSHTGLQTTEIVKELTAQFPAATLFQG
ncbi:hypothetical protein JHK82_055144 [Glycine max]|nr:hypothetical protein JHK85_055956 [Glycine max]KAG5073774.1 hypothetical protein JHK84_055005 [Glycine max]KAG5076449.1 hypothetical protein JHK82_055144 [Glycine max]